MGILVICLLTETKSLKFKADNGNVNFPIQFCLGSISNGGNIYDFSVDYDSVDKSDILNTYKYLVVKNDNRS